MQDVTSALNNERSIVRTWLMRGTLHLVASDDLPWMLDLFGPVFARGNQARHAELGLDPPTKSRGVAAIRRILAGAGPLTRYEIVDQLRRHGISLDRRTQAPIHLIQVAALEGVLCLGPDRENGDSTYVLIEDWVGKTPSRSTKAGADQLARRYFAAFGPATLGDLKTWSGLPIGPARAALTAAKPSLAEVRINREPAFMLKERLINHRDRRRTRPSVRLLPAFDTYLLGYGSRDLAVPPVLQRRLQRGGGWLHPAVVVNGRAFGAWSLRRSGGRGQALVETLGPIRRPIRQAIEVEVADIGRFLDVELSVSENFSIL